ncbi:MAG: diguanylate cyclase [Gemmatimonadaceae bacterium]
MIPSIADAVSIPEADSVSALVDRAHACERDSLREEARDLYEQALRRLTHDDAEPTATSIVRWIARTYLAEARHDEARDCLQLSLALAELAGDEAAVGHSMNQFAILHWRQGDLDSAKRLYLLAREHAMRSDEARLVAMTSTNIGVIASVRGDHEQALRYFESSLREYRLLGMTRDVCIALNNVGLVHTVTENWEAAESEFREALQIAQSLDDVEVATQLETNLANVAIKRGDFQAARVLCERALLAAKAHRLGDTLGGAYKLAGLVSMGEGDLEAALVSFDLSAEVAAQRENYLLHAEVERERSQIYRRLGRNREALRSLNTAHRLFTKMQARHDIAQIAKETRGLEGEFLEVARRWGESTESKDQYTQGHCERVADVSCRLAAAMGFPEPDLFWFRIGALLHDVGKLIVPSDVLNKPGKLTKEEWELMKRHPVAGVELLSEVEFPWDVLPIVRSHHECWDGSGYPDGLVGDDIPLVARIACLADVYDALTTERSYKRALPHAEAIDVMRRDVGRQFEAQLFAVFERVMHQSAGDGTKATPPDAAVAKGAEDRARPAVDELTGLSTRRGFVDSARVLLNLASTSATVAIAVIDVDHFKSVNDTFGHLQGDDVLQIVARTLAAACRPTDLVGRYAGDEFVMLFPETTESEVQRICDRVREEVASRRIPVRGSEERWVGVSLSIGLAVAPLHGENFEDLFASADRALYDAKRRGRNAVAIADRDNEPGKPKINTQRFVGRQTEVARLLERVEGCVRGVPGLVSVVGEAGVGKTTLVNRMASEVRLRTGAFVTTRSLEPDVRPPYGVWADVVGQLHKLRIVADREWPHLERIVPALRSESGSQGEGAPVVTSKYALLDELALYLRAAATSRPLVLVLDDVQWADHASWEALEHLVGSLDDDRLLICLTIRREDAQQFEASRRRLSRYHGYHEIRLERLSAHEVGEWIADVLHQAEGDTELNAFLYRYTEGNPLFVVQVLQTLVDEGVLWYGGKRWEWERVDAMQLPVAVDDLLARRLGRLSPSTATVMTAAAVIGRTFDFDLLGQVAGLSEDALLDAVDEAVVAGVVDTGEDRDGSSFHFSHTLLADSLIRQANPRRVKRLHAKIAEVLESSRPDSLTEIAVHYDAAGEDAHAFSFALRSGRRAASVYALEDAIASFSIAVRRAPTLSERMEARFALIDVARISGRYEAAQVVCDEALAELTDEDAHWRLRIRRMGLQLQLMQARNLEGLLTESTKLLQSARALEAAEESVLILSGISEAYTRLSRREDAEREARAATAEAQRLGDATLIADSRLRLGTALLEASPKEALVEFESARAAFEERDNRYGVVRCLINAGIAHSRVGAAAEAAEAERSYIEAQSAATEANIPDLGALAALNLGVLHQKTGEFERATEDYAFAQRMFAKVHNEARGLAAMYNAANLAREQGDEVAALGMYERVHALAAELSITDIEVGALAGAGLAALVLGHLDQALMSRARAAERSAALGDRWYQGREMLEALNVRYLLLTDRSSQAVVAYERAIELARSIDEYASLWLVSECGPPLVRAGATQFVDRVREACARATECGFRPLAARLAAPIR